MHLRARRVALSLAALGLLTACGSTVRLGAGGAAANSLAGNDGLGLGTTAPTGTDVAAAGAEQTPGGAGSSVVASPSGSDSTASSGGYRGDYSGTIGPPLSQAVGVTSKTVTIGISNVSNADSQNQSLGVNFSTGDTKGEIDAVVAYINAHGAIGGRKLTPYFHPVNGSDQTKSTAQKSQEACTDYTQDHKVFAVLDSAVDANFLSCMSKTGIVVSGYEDAGYNETDFARYPYFFDVNTLAGEKAYGSLPPLLLRQGYFSAWDASQGAPASGPAIGKPVVGVLSVDFPELLATTQQQLLPGLAKAGYPVKSTNVVYLHNPDSQAGAAQVISAIASAVLRFRSAGVTHVIITDNAGGVTYFFANAAESQGYRPRYGLTTANELEGFLQTGQFPTRQAAGAMGLGYSPLSDLPTSANPDLTGRFTNPTRKLCLSIFNTAHITFPDQNSKAIAFNYCDKLLFFSTVANRVKGDLTRSSFLAAVESLGSTGFTPSALQRARFAPGHHWADTVGYDLRYDASCGCMRYFGVPFSLD